MKSKLIVKFSGASDIQIAWGMNDNPNDVLVFGEEYDVIDVNVRSMHTKIKIRGFEDYWFNDSSFKYIGDEPDRQLLFNERIQSERNSLICSLK